MTGETPPAKNALEILPLEVWSKIFDELESPTDLETCFRTCRDWMTFLEPNRINFLMPKIFPLICKHLIVKMENEEEDDDESANGPEEDESPIPNPILSTRLVCKSWKYAVDSFLQNHPYHTNIDFPNEQEILDHSKAIKALPIKHYHFDITNVDDLEKLVETNFPSDCNPILTRCVKYYELVYEGPGNEANHFARLRTAFTNLLELHGTQVWHASFCLRFPTIDNIDEKSSVYNLIHRYLSLMPNLKTLNLTFCTAGSSWNLLSATPSLEELLVTNPLPTFQQLTTLEMNCVPDPLEKGMLFANSHVRNLFWVSKSMSVSSTWLLDLQMNNLEEFTTHVEFDLDFRTLQSLNWPFKKLAIGTRHVLLDSAIRTISASHFANNLKHLIVHVVGDEGFHKLRGKLELPNLITFQIITDCTPLQNIDFLLPTCNSLSSLQIVMNAEQQPTRSMTTRSMKKEVRISSSNQVVQFYDYIPNMLESNIWKHFPKLKHLEIVIYDPIHLRDFSFSCCGGEPDDNHFKNETHEYTREDWQKFVKNQSK